MIRLFFNEALAAEEEELGKEIQPECNWSQCVWMM